MKDLRGEIRETVMKWRYDDGYVYHEDLIKDLEALVKARIGFLRQWLNERTDKRLITNEDLETWLLK